MIANTRNPASHTAFAVSEFCRGFTFSKSPILTWFGGFGLPGVTGGFGGLCRFSLFGLLLKLGKLFQCNHPASTLVGTTQALDRPFGTPLVVNCQLGVWRNIDEGLDEDFRRGWSAVFEFDIPSVQGTIRFTAVVQIAERGSRLQRKGIPQIDAVRAGVLRIINHFSLNSADFRPLWNRTAGENPFAKWDCSNSDPRIRSRHRLSTSAPKTFLPSIVQVFCRWATRYRGRSGSQPSHGRIEFIVLKRGKKRGLCSRGWRGR